MKTNVVKLVGSILLGGVAILVALSACGGSTGGTTPAPATPQATATSTPTPIPVPTATPPPAQPSTPPPAQPSASTRVEIAVSEEDNTFLPEVIRVKAGAKVVFVITNKGPAMHSLEVPDFKLYVEVKAGETVRLEWTVPDKKGSWDIGCYLSEPMGAHDGMDKSVLIIE